VTKHKTHTHTCQVCSRPFQCDGLEEENYDGFPEVICVLFHVDGQRTCPECRWVGPNGD
jgi:hypothetical protein